MHWADILQTRLEKKVCTLAGAVPQSTTSLWHMHGIEHHQGVSHTVIMMQIYGTFLQYQTLQGMKPHCAGSLVSAASMSTLILASSSLNVWHTSQQVKVGAR